MSSPIREKDVQSISGHVPKVEQDVKPLVPGSWIDMGPTDGDRTRRFKIAGKPIPADQSAKDFADKEKSRGPLLFKSKAGTDIASSKKKEPIKAGVDIASIIKNLLAARPDIVCPEQQRVLIGETSKIWNCDMLPTYDDMTKNRSPATTVPYYTTIAPTQQLTAMAANAPAPPNLAGEAEFYRGYGQTHQVEAYNTHRGSACKMEVKEPMAMFQPVLKGSNTTAQETTPASNGHPSGNGSARSSATFVNDIPVHQAPTAAECAGMTMFTDELQRLEAIDCNEMMPPWTSEDGPNLELGGEEDDEHNLDHDLTRIFNSANAFGTATAADADHSPHEQFFSWHQEHGAEEDADLELTNYELMTQISFFNQGLVAQQQVHAPQGQTSLPPCLPPAGNGSDSAPLFDTFVMAKMYHRDSNGSDISDTRCQMMDAQGMPSHDGNCMQRMGSTSSLEAEDDLQAVHAAGRGSSMKRNYSFMMEVPTLAGHASLGMTSHFRNGSMTETQMRFMVMESDKRSEDRECHDHAANAQLQVPVVKKTKDRDITRADLKEVYHLPMSEAGQKLNLGSTAMKDLCRNCKIERWPYRKLSSLNSLLCDVEAEMELYPTEEDLKFIKEKILNNRAEIMMEPNTPIELSVKNLRQTNFKNKYKRKVKPIK
eukprot:gene5222-18450_t